MKIEKGMYVKTSEIEGTKQWVQVIDAFVAAGFTEAEGYTEHAEENYTDDWMSWQFLGVTRHGNVFHTSHTESFSQLISVDDLLCSTELETPANPAPDADRQSTREQFWRDLYLKLSGRYDLPYCAEMCDKALAELDERFGEKKGQAECDIVPSYSITDPVEPAGWIEFDGRNGPTSDVATVDIECNDGSRITDLPVRGTCWDPRLVSRYRIKTIGKDYE